MDLMFTLRLKSIDLLDELNPLANLVITYAGTPGIIIYKLISIFSFLFLVRLIYITPKEQIKALILLACANIIMLLIFFYHLYLFALTL